MQAEDIQRIRQQDELKQQQHEQRQQQLLINRTRQLLRRVTVDENPRVCDTLRQVNQVLEQHLKR